MATLDAVLAQVSEPDKLSFYGLTKVLEKVENFLSIADHALITKSPGAESREVAERKDDLIEAQGQLRRAMGQRLDKPQLTKRERPLAEAFIEQQLSRLKRGCDGSNERIMRGVERLETIRTLLRSCAAVPDGRHIREAESAIQRFEAEWKEVEPLYLKWEAGRHSFKSNDDLQAFKKRYEACRKGRESAAPKLEELLCKSFSVVEAEAFAKEEADQERLRREGWAGAARKPPSQPPQPCPAGRATVSKKRPPAPKKGPVAWESANMTMAQRLRAEAAAKLRDEAAAEGDGSEDVEEGEEIEETVAVEEEEEDDAEPLAPQRPLPPPVPMIPKQPPKFQPIHQAGGPKVVAPAADVEEDEEEVDDEVVIAEASTTKTATKRKGKASKKKDTASATVPAATVAAQKSPGKGSPFTVCLSAAEMVIRGSLLQELFHPSSWRLPANDEAAESRLTDLAAMLPWNNPLGLCLSFNWRTFGEMEVDFGPAPSSKRDASPTLERLQQNLPKLMAHYVTALFFFLLMSALSHFGILFWLVILQGALMLIPPDTLPQLSRPMRVVLLQAVHLVLWLLFVRCLWLLHFWIKLFSALVMCSHAYAVKPLADP
eukprot:TRINITY_DN23074_c0_g1_i1.p1 TRINITY_DN23074_c0_g1~~TRINITY_DN23074_c0_g1_i1.p1  ORF type:complete len:624 (+),score=135.00 TRINITY_DN23074_c0_g1_i1:67-1872(+)